MTKKRYPTPGGLMKIGPSEARMDELQDVCRRIAQSRMNKIVLKSSMFLESLVELKKFQSCLVHVFENE
jgi:hypothetical protein